jgi:hypothetical protein
LDSTNKVCEVTPFFDTYELVKEVMVTRCGTVCASPDTGCEYLLHQGQDLWNQNDSFLNLNDCKSKRPNFNM